MVHADVGIALLQEAINGGTEQTDARGAVRQIRFIDAALRLEAFGQMRIGVQRNAVRAQRHHLLDSASERFGGL
ncbi:hypothetical protein D3C72_2101050 [compost metagenome]